MWERILIRWRLLAKIALRERDVGEAVRAPRETKTNIGNEGDEVQMNEAAVAHADGEDGRCDAM